jgi:hypothetical protein
MVKLHEIHGLNLVGGIPTPLKNMKVKWEYEIVWNSQDMEKKHVPNHESEIVIYPIEFLKQMGTAIPQQKVTKSSKMGKSTV